MSWEKEKVILIVLGVILLGAMCFLLGTALGVSIDRGNFTETLLPVLSVIGSWVSGVGALGAVTVALWIAEKQRRSEKEDLELDFGFVIVPGFQEAVLMISAVSVGKRPSEINSISVYGKNATVIMHVARFLNVSSQLPTNLGYGKKANFLCEEGFEIHIGEYLNTYCDGTSKDLKVCVSTTTENFIYIPDESMKSALDSFAKKAGRAPEPIKKNG
ncbi:hypothetical protein GCM10025856_16410 [Methylophaga marina]|uniref:Uncharacterized protein n=1 Tax=Methylophaga marina TaxID=45495 RepID=A0ABP3DHM1_9GAMM|nr:hypothetical protein [Methylophaga marina]BDZ73922.1 hypothetical protein GCM10025856_16410 [Methylophaga marina]